MRRERELHFELMENARDFIEQAVADARGSTPRSWKYAVIHLASGVELLFKAILQREHWSLLFDDVDAAKEDSLRSGNFRSVDFSRAEERLVRIVHVSLSNGEREFLKTLRDLRNRMVHFGFSVTEGSIRSLVQKGWALFIRLYEEWLPENVDAAWVHEVSQDLVSFAEFVRERLSQLEPRLRDAEKPSRNFRTCPSCAQDTLVVDNDFETVTCLFCGESSDVVDLAGTSEGEGGPCPACEHGHLGFILRTNEDGQFECVLCGFRTDRSYNEECPRCGEVFWNEDEDVMCPDCWRHIADSD